MAKKVKETWVGGLSECCDAPLKEVGEWITILICSECHNMANRKYDEDDDSPYDDE